MILSILKIIGLVLLGILAVLLVLLLIFLFWPVFYKIKAVKKEHFSIYLRFSFLFHILTAKLYYEKEPLLTIRVFGIPVYKNDFRTNPKNENDVQKEAKSEDTVLQQEMQTKDTASQQDGQEETPEQENLRIEQQLQDTPQEEEEEQLFQNSPFFIKLRGYFRKIKELILKFIQKCYTIKNSVVSFYHKLEGIQKSIRYYYKVYQHPSMQPAWTVVKSQMWKLIKHMKPKVLRVNLHFGSGDPATTAQVYGYYCMIYPFYRKQISFIPEFEDKVFELTALAKGHIHMGKLLWIGWKIYSDRNIRKIIRLIKREESRRGRK